MRKVAAFFFVVLFYVFVAYGFTWADNSGAIDRVIYILGIDNSSVAQTNSSEIADDTIAGMCPVPPPPYPEPGTERPDVKFAGMCPVPPPPYPEPGTERPDVKFAGMCPVPPPPYPEPGTEPHARLA